MIIEHNILRNMLFLASQHCFCCHSSCWWRLCYCWHYTAGEQAFTADVVAVAGVLAVTDGAPGANVLAIASDFATTSLPLLVSLLLRASMLMRPIEAASEPCLSHVLAVDSAFVVVHCSCCCWRTCFFWSPHAFAVGGGGGSSFLLLCPLSFGDK